MDMDTLGEKADSMRWKNFSTFYSIVHQQYADVRKDELKFCNYASNNIINNWMDQMKPLKRHRRRAGSTEVFR